MFPISIKVNTKSSKEDTGNKTEIVVMYLNYYLLSRRKVIKFTLPNLCVSVYI